MLKKFFKDSIIYGIAAVLPRIINFLLVRLHTDSLPAASYAENTDFYIWATILATLLSLGFETTFFRFFKDEQYKKSIISTSMLSIGVGILIFLAVFSIFFSSIQLYLGFGEHPIRLKMFMAILAIDALALIPFAYLRATNRPMRYTTIKLINVGVIVIIQLFALRFIPNWLTASVEIPNNFSTFYYSLNKVDYIFLSNLAGSLLSLLLVLPYIKNTTWHFNKELLKKMLRYSYPIIVAGLAYDINENLDKWLIGGIIDKGTEGLYAAAYKLAVFMNLYIMAFRLGAEPLFFNISDKKNAPETYAVIMKYFVIAGSTVFIGVVLFIDFFKHLINPNYWIALNIVPIVLLAYLFLGIYHNLSIWYKLTDQTKYGMWFSVIGAVVTIVLNMVFLPKSGYIAAAWATLVAYGCMTLLSYYFGKNKYPIPYELRYIILYLGLSTAISFLVFYMIKPPLYIKIMIMLLWMIAVISLERKKFLQQYTHQ